MSRARTPALLVLEDGRSFRGRAYGAEGETFGEAVFSTGMTGYQETLTDPSLPPARSWCMTAPHIGNTGVERRGRRVRRGSGWPATSSATRPGSPSNWRADAHARRRARRPGRRRHQRRRHPRADPAPARARRDAGRRLLRSTRRPARRCCERVLRQPPMVGADLAGEVTTDDAYVVAGRSATQRFTVAALDLGHQGQDPAPDCAERGIEVHVLPADVDARRRSLAVEPDGGVLLATARATRRPPTTPVGADCARCSTRRIPLLRHLLRQPDPRPGARASAPTSWRTATAASTSRCMDRTTGKVEITAHNHGFAVDAPLDGERALDTAFGARRGQPRLPQRRRGRGPAAASTCRPSRCSTTPRPRPARTTRTTCSTGSPT